MLRGVSRHFPGAEGGPGSAWDPMAPRHPQPSLHRHPPRGGQEQVRVTLETLALQSLPRRRPPAPLTCSERGVYMAPGQHPPGHPNKRVPHFLRTGTTLHSLNPQAVATLLRVSGAPIYLLGVALLQAASLGPGRGPHCCHMLLGHRVPSALGFGGAEGVPGGQTPRFAVTLEPTAGPQAHGVPGAPDLTPHSGPSCPSSQNRWLPSPLLREPTNPLGSVPGGPTLSPLLPRDGPAQQGCSEGAPTPQWNFQTLSGTHRPGGPSAVLPASGARLLWLHPPTPSV